VTCVVLGMVQEWVFEAESGMITLKELRMTEKEGMRIPFPEGWAT
jgi:hypothetical protein